jgi:DNA polymerase-3 subunit beta
MTINAIETVTVHAATVDATNVRDALRLLKLGAPTRAALPIFTAVRVTATPYTGTVTLESYDFETGVIVNMPATVAGDGFRTSLVDFRAFTAALKGRKGAVTLERTAAGGVKVGPVTLAPVTAGQATADETVADLPTLPSLHPAAGDWRTGDMTDALGVVLPAAGDDMTLPTLTGVRVETTGGTVSAAATDRYRLHWSDGIPCTFNGAAADSGALIPARTLASILVAARDHAVTITGRAGEANGGNVRVDVAPGKRYPMGATVYARCTDGTFPKYRALIPSEHAAELTCDAVELIDAITQCATVLDRNTPVRLERDHATGWLTVIGRGGAGEARITVRATITGELEPCAFNPAYLSDAIGAVAGKGATVSMRQTAQARPHVFAGDRDGSALVMPVRISG